MKSLGWTRVRSMEFTPQSKSHVWTEPPSGQSVIANIDLILEDGFWKIQRSEDGEIRKNPIKPQKGRVMKAGDFQGKSKTALIPDILFPATHSLVGFSFIP